MTCLVVTSPHNHACTTLICEAPLNERKLLLGCEGPPENPAVLSSSIERMVLSYLTHYSFVDEGGIEHWVARDVIFWMEWLIELWIIHLSLINDIVGWR